jgi:hypothetical protein
MSYSTYYLDKLPPAFVARLKEAVAIAVKPDVDAMVAKFRSTAVKDAREIWQAVQTSVGAQIPWQLTDDAALAVACDLAYIFDDRFSNRWMSVEDTAIDSRTFTKYTFAADLVAALITECWGLHASVCRKTDWDRTIYIKLGKFTSDEWRKKAEEAASIYVLQDRRNNTQRARDSLTKQVEEAKALLDTADDKFKVHDAELARLDAILEPRLAAEEAKRAAEEARRQAKKESVRKGLATKAARKSAPGCPEPAPKKKQKKANKKLE